MTDRDVVDRVRSVVGLGRTLGCPRQKPHHKDSYVWVISAKYAVDELCRLLRPHMGKRRRAQIDACLTAVHESGGTDRRQRQHGHSRYERDGCRCDVCYEAKSAANARRVRKRAAVV